MERTQREWFRQQFKEMAAAGKEHKPLCKDYHRAYQRWYDWITLTRGARNLELEADSDGKYTKWQSHNYNSYRFTALLNIYHLLKEHGVCTHHKYKLRGECYSHNWHIKKWLESGLIDGFTKEMSNLLLQDGSES